MTTHTPLYGSLGFQYVPPGALALSEDERTAIALAALFYAHEDTDGLSAERVRATLAGLLARTQKNEPARPQTFMLDDSSPSAAWDA